MKVITDRQQYPAQLNSGKMRQTEKYVAFTKYHQDTRRFGKLGRALCNQEFLDGNKYPEKSQK